MYWHFQRRTSLSESVDLALLDLDAAAELSRDELQRLPLRVGRCEVPLAEVFELQAAKANEHLFTGDLRRDTGLATGLASARVQVRGDAGPLTGCRMRGGELIVTGDVGSGVGAAMTGGIIRAGGNAAGEVAPCLADEKYGMNGGEIFIAGSADYGVGCRMRRGLIVVAGDAQGGVAVNMLAGTIVIGGSAGANAGCGMRRGTVIVGRPDTQTVLPTFGESVATELVVFRVLRRYLQQQTSPLDLPWLDKAVQRYWGDPVHGSRGEVILPA